MRKLLFPDRDCITLSIRVPAKYVQRLNEDADIYGVTRNQVAAKIIEVYYEEEE